MYISVDFAYHEIVRAKVGKGGISTMFRCVGWISFILCKQYNLYLVATYSERGIGIVSQDRFICLVSPIISEMFNISRIFDTPQIQSLLMHWNR